jgi:hypothetical protein
MYPLPIEVVSRSSILRDYILPRQGGSSTDHYCRTRYLNRKGRGTAGEGCRQLQISVDGCPHNVTCNCCYLSPLRL